MAYKESKFRRCIRTEIQSVEMQRQAMIFGKQHTAISISKLQRNIFFHRRLWADIRKISPAAEKTGR